MPRRISLVVLHEDTLHQAFAAAFINRMALPARMTPRYVSGGSKAGVANRFPQEVASLLSQGAETHLLVLMDADAEPYSQNETLLLNRLSLEDRARLEKLGRWVLICPKFELENWCRNLEGLPVDELRNPGLSYTHDSECRPAARRLADSCKSHTREDAFLPSLINACEHWNAYRKRHGF